MPRMANASESPVLPVFVSYHSDYLTFRGLTETESTHTPQSVLVEEVSGAYGLHLSPELSLTPALSP